jgi:hypothetical protein
MLLQELELVNRLDAPNAGSEHSCRIPIDMNPALLFLLLNSRLLEMVLLMQMALSHEKELRGCFSPVTYILL